MIVHPAQQALGVLVARNNERIRATDAGEPNPRRLETVEWHRTLVRDWPIIRMEWDSFVAGGGRLPLLDDVIGEPQGSTKPWRAGLLLAAGRPAGPFAERFPRTLVAMESVPGIRSALWSVLTPGAEIPEHSGPNAGILRYHLGIDCPEGAALRVGKRVVPYRNQEGVLFDDTAPHAAWNHGDRNRVTLFLELLRPLPRWATLRNRLVQSLVMLDQRYRGAPSRATEWDKGLNS
jgi:beta-hydroxylase